MPADVLLGATGQPEPDTHVQVSPKVLYFGMPVALISSQNPDGTPNLAPMSSVWSLGYTLMLGLGADGQKTLLNLERQGELVLNLPGPDIWESVESLAGLTGSNPVPEVMRAFSRFEPNKFEAAGLTPQSSMKVSPPRVAECGLQLEAVVTRINRIGPDRDIAAVEAEVVQVHAWPEIMVPKSDYIDTDVWRPLVYSFRHYFTLADRELGASFKEKEPTVRAGR